MLMDNTLVVLFMSIPFFVFLGLKYQTYRKQKKMELADEINSILSKHGKPSNGHLGSKDHLDKNKAA